MRFRFPIAGGLLAGLAFAGAAEAAGPQVAVRVQERTLIVDGTTRADTIAFRVSPANPTRVAVDGDGDGAAELRVRRDRFDRIVVLAGGGRDTVSVTGAVAFTEPITLEGGDGADTLGGARGPETFVGGDGDDVVEGGGGADVAFLGAGDDRFAWDPGDGSDVVEGQSGEDKLTFNGSGAAERFDVSAAGRRVRLLRDVGAVEMDLAGIDRIRTNALGGADTFVAADLGDTGVDVLDTELAGAPGTAGGDGQDDRIVLEGTGGEDRAEIGGTARVATVDGLSASVRIRHTDADDALTVHTLGRDDTVDAATLRASALHLTVDAGAGDDDLFGGAGDDVLLGGDGDDLADPNRGEDVALLGDQADTFRWDPGDGSDTVEGQAGRDTLALNGSAANERIVATANGQRVRVTRNVGAVELDLGDIEQLDANPLGGEDTIRVEDLSGTSMATIAASLAEELGGTAGDRQIDSVIVKGTSDPDNLGLNGANGTVNVTGLRAAVQIRQAEGGRDKVSVNGRGGADTFDPTGLAPNTIGFTFVQ